MSFILKFIPVFLTLVLAAGAGSHLKAQAETDAEAQETKAAVEAAPPAAETVTETDGDESGSSIPSGTVHWQPLELTQNIVSAEQPLMQGESTLLSKLNVSAMAIKSSGKFTSLDSDRKFEQLLIVKSGFVRIKLGKKEHAIGPRSIALIMPGDAYSVTNAGHGTAELYRMAYQSKEPVDIARGRQAGGSMVVDANELEFRPHGLGGLHDYFDRDTSMCGNFEMHVTTLNGLLQSHEPHTHKSEEIILLVSGTAEEFVAGAWHPIKTGDFAFLDSNVEHAIRNTGTSPCVYFAYQWR